MPDEPDGGMQAAARCRAAGRRDPGRSRQKRLRPGVRTLPHFHVIMLGVLCHKPIIEIPGSAVKADCLEGLGRHDKGGAGWERANI